MATQIYRLISHFHSIYNFLILFIKLYLDIMDDGKKS